MSVAVDLDVIMSELATSSDTAYVTTRDLRIVRTNDGWTRFALANGGEATPQRCQPGYRIDDALPASLRDFYIAAFERAFAARRPFEHDYECSSADVLRRMRMIVYPIADSFLLFVHSVRFEEEHVRIPAEMPSSHAGLPTMCAHCRRVRGPNGSWLWVPAFVASPPPNVSHGLCEPCAEFYYPAMAG